MRTRFTAVWRITARKNGAGAQGLQQVLGLKSYKAAWAWPHKIRTATEDSSRPKLSGTAETGGACRGGSEKGGKRGRGSENKAVAAIAAGLKDNLPGRVRTDAGNEASNDTLRRFVKDNIEPGATPVTDARSGYFGIEREGYGREAINQSKAEHEEELLPRAHMIAALLKRRLLGTHQGAVSRKHLPAYRDEFVFRFNRRKSAKRGLLFYRLLENAMKVPPATLDGLLN